MKRAQIKSFPKFFGQLSQIDQVEYINLQKNILKSFLISKNPKICDNFQNVFDLMKEYIQKDPETQNIKSLVCGIFWMDDYIVINTRQLQYIIGKCKSSINNGIQAIGYVLVPTTAEIATELGKLFPFLKNNFSEMRQWTVRKLSKQETPSTGNKTIPNDNELPDIFDFNPFSIKVEEALPEDLTSLAPLEVPYIPDQFFVDQESFWFH